MPGEVDFRSQGTGPRKVDIKEENGMEEKGEGWMGKSWRRDLTGWFPNMRSFLRLYRNWILNRLNRRFLLLHDLLQLLESQFLSLLSIPQNFPNSRSFKVRGMTSISGFGVICFNSASLLRTTNFSSPFYHQIFFRNRVYSPFNKGFDILKDFDETTINP